MRSGWRKWSSILPWGPCPAWGVGAGSGHQSYLKVPVQHEEWVQEVVIHLTLRSLSSMRSGCRKWTSISPSRSLSSMRSGWRKWSSILPWGPCPAWGVGAGSGHQSYLEVPVQHEEWVQEVDINLTLRSLFSIRSGCRKWSSILPWGPCPAWGVGGGSGHPSYLEVPVQHEEWVQEVDINLTLRSLSSMRSGCRKWSSILPWGPCPAWGVGAGSGHQSHLRGPCPAWGVGGGSGHPSYLEVPVQHEEWVQEVVIPLTLRSLSSMRSGCRKWTSILPWGPCSASGVGAGSGHPSYLEVLVQHEEWVEEVVIHLTLRSLSSMRSGCRKWTSILP